MSLPLLLNSNQLFKELDDKVKKNDGKIISNNN